MPSPVPLQLCLKDIAADRCGAVAEAMHAGEVSTVDASLQLFRSSGFDSDKACDAISVLSRQCEVCSAQDIAMGLCMAGWHELVYTARSLQAGLSNAAIFRVTVMQRLAVVDCSESRGKAIRLANPEILARSDDLFEWDEASPNLPGLSAKVKRPARVTVAFTDAVALQKRDQLAREKIGLGVSGDAVALFHGGSIGPRARPIGQVFVKGDKVLGGVLRHRRISLQKRGFLWPRE